MSTAVTPPPTGITVQRALELPGLRSGLPEVVACAERLGRTVRWVHAGEVPNIASLLKGGELLLTTGYGLGTRPADQRAFVRTLAERGIAALVVELGPRFSRLPAALVDAARAAGLPLVQLHREVPFVTVTEEIHTEIVNGHYALLQRAEEVHRRCTEALLGGGGVPQVLEILAGFTGNPVFLETTDGQLLYAAGEGPEGADPLQVWEGLRDRQRDDPPARHGPGGRARRRPRQRRGAGAAGAAAGAQRAGAGAPDGGRAGGGHPRPGADAGPSGGGAGGARPGRLPHRPRRGPDQRRGRARAGPGAGLQAGRGPLLPVVMRLGDTLSPQGGGWAVLARAVGEELSSLGVPVLLGVRPVEGRVPLLLGLRAESDRPSVADRVAAALRAGVERAGMLRPGGRPPVVVVGPAGDWAAVPTGLRHVVETATAAQGLPGRPWYDARRLDIDLLLWRLRDHPDLADFVRRAIGPVLDHDRRSRPALLPTLETYLAHAGRKAETARELHLNRQTLYNRLARIEELLGVDLDDPQTVLTLSLALRARRHVP